MTMRREKNVPYTASLMIKSETIRNFICLSVMCTTNKEQHSSASPPKAVHKTHKIK